MRCYRCHDRKGPYFRIDCKDVCLNCQRWLEVYERLHPDKTFSLGKLYITDARKCDHPRWYDWHGIMKCDHCGQVET